MPAIIDRVRLSVVCATVRMRSRRLAALVVAAGALLAAAAPVGARPSYTFRVPWGRLNGCANCHLESAGGGPRNTFGTFFEANEFEWTASLAALDSDGDGFTNGEELQDPAGTWNMDDPVPGNVLLVSSPGRVSSVPGERQIVLSEVRHAADGSFFAEVTNTSAAPVPLDQKWLVYADPFLAPIPHGGGSDDAAVTARGAPLPAEMRLVPFGDPSSIAPGEVRTFFLDRTGLPETALSADNGFVMLVLFESQKVSEPDGVDPSLSHTIGDYVQWGSMTQSFTSSAQDNAFLPQWDADTGLPFGVPAGASIEYALAGQARRDWFPTVPTLTFGVARPVAALARPTALAFPVGGLDGGAATPGFETVNFAPQWAVPERWPHLYGVIVGAPATAPSTRPGERALRLSTNIDPAEPAGPYRTAIAVPGPLGTGEVARVAFDLLLPVVPASPDPPGADAAETLTFEASVGDGAQRITAALRFTSGVATAVLLVDGAEAASGELFAVGALDPTSDWVAVGITCDATDVDFTATFSAARRDGSLAVTPVSLSAPLGSFAPVADSAELAFTLPAAAFDVYVNDLRTLAVEELRTGYAVVR